MTGTKANKTSSEICAPEDPEPIPGFSKFGFINLQGVNNCRDLGGLPTRDGRQIRKRRLLRSGGLEDATAEDMRQLTRMHDLSYVVDLRAPYEVENQPDPLPLMRGVEYTNLAVLTDNSIGFTGLKHLGSDLKTLRQFMKSPYQLVLDLYPKSVLSEQGIKSYSTLLNNLLEYNNGATLWHCTQGKDRTGIGALLIEYALGVPPEYIRADYLATNLFIKPWVDKISSAMLNNPIGHGIGLDLEAYSYASICYFDAAVNAIDESYGNIDNYMQRALDFGPEKQTMLRALYLE